MPDLGGMMAGMREQMSTILGAPPKTPPPTAQETPAGPDPYADSEAIVALVTKFRDDWGKKEIREQFIRTAYRNILFSRGIQWIRWTGAAGGARWRPANVPRGVPTPVTNRFASTMDAVVSVFARIEPQLNFRPGSPDEPQDRAAADVSIRAIQVVEDEVEIRIQRQFLAAWVGYVGGAFLETGYDPDPAHGLRTIPVDQCPGCSQTQPQGAPMCESCGQWGPMTPQTMQVPRGKMYTDVVPLFEAFFDPSIPNWTRHKRFLREKAISVEEAKERWPQIADQITANVSGTADEHYMTALATQGAPLDERSTGRRDHATAPLLNNRCTERWYWQLPNATYPDGLLAIVVGAKALAYAKPLPYWATGPDGDKRRFLPFTWFPQKLVPGTFWPKTVADDLALKQMQRNRWESAIELCGMRMGMPIWLRPRGANVAGLTQGGGEAGAVLDYNALGPGAAKPERIPGQPLPMSFIEHLALIDKDFEELAATFDVIKGARPEGVSAGIALQILQERGMSRYGPLFILWETAWAEWARQALEIFRQFATEERLLRIQGADGRWQVQKFIGADLQGRIDVVAEAGSSMPRSSLLDRAEMEQLSAQRVINPQDPETQYKFLEVYGRTNLLPSMQLDTKNAIMEDEAFEQIALDPLWRQATPQDVAAIQEAPDYPSVLALLTTWEQSRGMQPVPWPKVWPGLDNHAIHSREHGKYGKSETFRTQFPEIVQAIFEKHKSYHDQLAIQQAAALQGGGQIQGGFLQPAPGGAMPPASRPGPAMSQPMNTSSSGQRMAGDFAEMQDQQLGGGA